MSPRPLFALLVVVSALPACYVSHESLTVRRSDGGVAPPTDAARPPARRDAGMPPMDSGFGCFPDVFVPPYDGAGCREDTRRCVDDCFASGDPEFCFQDCVASDPECSLCFNQTLISCANGLGCQPEWDEFACCAWTVNPECRDRRDATLIECGMGCEPNLERYSECINAGPAVMECVARIGDVCGIRLF